MGISKLIAGTAVPFAAGSRRAFLFNISMISVMLSECCQYLFLKRINLKVTILLTSRTNVLLVALHDIILLSGRRSQ